MAFQNTNTKLIAAIRKHVENKGVATIDTEDLKRLCNLAERAISLDPKLDVEFIA